MRGIVERTRVAIVEVAARRSSITTTGRIQEVTTDGDTAMEDAIGQDEYFAEEDRGNWEMDIARVYERTIVLLGESLESSAASGIQMTSE